MACHGAACVHCGHAARATSTVPTHHPQAAAVSEGNFSAVGLHAGLLRVERCLNHDGEKQMVTSTACPLDVFCLTTLSNHFLFSLGFPYFLSLNHKRVFEVCSAPTSALSVLSGRGHGVQY